MITIFASTRRAAIDLTALIHGKLRDRPVEPAAPHPAWKRDIAREKLRSATSRAFTMPYRGTPDLEVTDAAVPPEPASESA